MDLCYFVIMLMKNNTAEKLTVFYRIFSIFSNTGYHFGFIAHDHASKNTQVSKIKEIVCSQISGYSMLYKQTLM